MAQERSIENLKGSGPPSHAWGEALTKGTCTCRQQNSEGSWEGGRKYLDVTMKKSNFQGGTKKETYSKVK